MDAPMVEHELKTDKTMVAEHDEACTAEVATWMQDGVVAYMAAFVLAWFLLFCGRRRVRRRLCADTKALFLGTA